jgi:CHAT domain-containing protein
MNIKSILLLIIEILFITSAKCSISNGNYENENPGIYFNRGTELLNKKNYIESIKNFEIAKNIIIRIAGEKDANVASCYNNIGIAYKSLRDREKAFNYFEKSIRIKESLGSQDVSIANSLDNIGQLYAEQHSYADAIQIFQQALTIRVEKLGYNNPATVDTIEELAKSYRAIGNYEEAYKKYETIFKINHDYMINDKQQYIKAIIGMINSNWALGNEKNNEELLKIALLQIEKDNENEATAEHLNNLSICFDGNIKKDLLTKASSIFKKIHPNDISAAEINDILFRVNENKEISINDAENLEKYISNGNAVYNCKYYEILSQMYYVLNNKDKSIYFAKKYKDALNDLLQEYMSISDKDRLSWGKLNISYDVPTLVFNDIEIGDCIVKWKGVVNDSILEDHRNKDKISLDIRNKITKLKDEFFKQKLSIECNNTKLNDIQLEINRLESLNAYSYRLKKRLKSNFNCNSVAESLSPNESVVDFITYRDPVSKLLYYGCLIINKSGKTSFIRMLDTKTIDMLVCNIRKSIVQEDKISFEYNSTKLFTALWSLIAQAIPNETQTIYISPEGQLNFLPFGVLMDEKMKFLSEKYNIYYLGSAADLLKPSTNSHKKTAILFANPKYQSDLISAIKYGDQKSNNKIKTNSFSGISFTDIPGTENEAKILADLLKKETWSVSEFYQADAKKEYLLKLNKPEILHLATHGFFLNNINSSPNLPDARGMKISSNANESSINSAFGNIDIDSMRASGLALSGAQSTIDYWLKGKVIDAENDGILTADDIASLDLDGTWLATLSACDTGVGEAKSGEGVFGLRRAFMIAGAQNLLMTLWPVSDEVTPKIMADFYKEALATHDAAGSLARVQREWLVKLRKEKGLMAAVRDVGPFAMVVMANPNARPPSHSNPEESPTPAAEATPRPVVAPGVSDSQSPPVASSIPEQKEQNKSQDIIPSATTASTPGVQSGDRRVLEFNEALAKADAGDAYAQGVVSIYYGLGYKTPKDVARAASYALKSAAQGNPLGIYRVGAMRSEGEGMQKNSDQGRTLKRKAFDGLNAMTGDPYALNILGIMSYSGEVIPQDTTEALQLYKQSADLGYAPAQYNYASLILNGGVAGDAEEATAYKGKAAAQNYP